MERGSGTKIGGNQNRISRGEGIKIASQLGEGPKSDPLGKWNNTGSSNREEDDIKGSPFSNKEEIVELARKLKNAIGAKKAKVTEICPRMSPLGA